MQEAGEWLANGWRAAASERLASGWQAAGKPACEWLANYEPPNGGKTTSASVGRKIKSPVDGSSNSLGIVTKPKKIRHAFFRVTTDVSFGNRKNDALPSD